MKRISRLFAAAALALPMMSFAAAPFVPPVPEIAGKAYFLTDFYSGQVLAARDPDDGIALVRALMARGELRGAAAIADSRGSSASGAMPERARYSLSMASALV